MVPTSLMLLLFMTVFGLSVYKFYTYYLHGQYGPYGVWLIGLVSALLGVTWPVVVGFRANTPEMSQLFLLFGVLLLCAMTVMLLRKTPRRRERKGLVVSVESQRAITKIQRENRDRGGRPGGPSGGGQGAPRGGAPGGQPGPGQRRPPPGGAKQEG